MFEVFKIYKTMPEFHCRCDTEDEAREEVAELRRDRHLDDAYFVEEKDED